MSDLSKHIETFYDTKVHAEWSEDQVLDLKRCLEMHPKVRSAWGGFPVPTDCTIEQACKEVYHEWARSKSVIGNHMHNYPTEFEDWRKKNPKNNQWLEIKKQYPDTIVMVQNGKFYELFHEDADVFHRTFQAVYMHGYVAHTGYPISCHDKMVRQLKHAGYISIRII